MPVQQVEHSIAKPPEPLAKNSKAEWALDPSIVFLNHGSFGARPLAVLEAQQTLRREFEARPIEWLNRRRHELIDQAKLSLAPLIGAAPANFGFVANATDGINAVLRSIAFGLKHGDELITTDHVYNAVRKAMQYIARSVGAKYVEAHVPLPLRSPDEVIDVIDHAITNRTKLVVIDHITSPTAVIFPIKQIIELCNQRGVDVLVDGAHAPGMIDLNIEELSPAYYAANLHKWVCAPPGAAFLWVRPDKQKAIHPTTISHFLDESFVNEFNWQGTRDITPWLCVKDSIAYLEKFGLERVMRHNHEMAMWVQDFLCRSWRVNPATPIDGSMLGSMATVELPGQDKLRSRFGTTVELQAAIYDRHRIEVPVVDWGGRWWVRPCCQIYNTVNDYERLAEAVMEVTNDE